MENQLIAIRDKVLSQLPALSKSAELDALRISVLGKKGELTAIMRVLGTLSSEERPAAGALINKYRDEIESALTDRESELRKAEREAKLQAEAIDVTLPAPKLKRGGLNPVSITLSKMIEVFTGMGFEVVEGPEIEYDRYNFELLNIPKNHPARDMQDTFYINENIVLRTHTSPAQARTMLSRKPPIRIICPGKTYRSDDDATHSPVFHQIEGLVIDKGITMGDLKGTLDIFAEAMFGEGTKTRLRPSFFPFTEPSAEVDVTCAGCKGEGCRICKGTGWMEILGSGMVNPKVLELCGIDSSVYTGFAFGIGIDRVADIRYAIPDMRWLFENDARFIRQFNNY